MIWECSNDFSKHFGKYKTILWFGVYFLKSSLYRLKSKETITDRSQSAWNKHKHIVIKLLKTKKKIPGAATQKQSLVIRQQGFKGSTDFMRNHVSGRKWNMLRVLEGNNCHFSLPYSVKIWVQKEMQLSHFLSKETVFVVSGPALQQWLQTQGKRWAKETEKEVLSPDP